MRLPVHLSNQLVFRTCEANVREEAESRHVHLVCAVGKIRSASLHGREHVVVPIVALVEGVIFPVNADTPELVLAEELGHSPQGWNGRPVYPYHPSEGGRQVSGNIPRIMEAGSFGTLFGTGFDGKRLNTEAWLDPMRAEKVGRQAQRVIERARNGEPIEVSVGAFVTAERRNGQFNGKSYKAVWRHIVPDHLAMLPEGTLGACSNAMGCGIRTNAGRTEDRPVIHVITEDADVEPVDLTDETAIYELRSLIGNGNNQYTHGGARANGDWKTGVGADGKKIGEGVKEGSKEDKQTGGAGYHMFSSESEKHIKEHDLTVQRMAGRNTVHFKAPDGTRHIHDHHTDTWRIHRGSNMKDAEMSTTQRSLKERLLGLLGFNAPAELSDEELRDELNDLLEPDDLRDAIGNGNNQYTRDTRGAEKPYGVKVGDVKPGDTIHDYNGKTMLHVTRVEDARAKGHKVFSGIAGEKPPADSGVKPGDRTSYAAGHHSRGVMVSSGHPDHPHNKDPKGAAGRRHSATDVEMIQAMHDKSVDLGATCYEDPSLADRLATNAAHSCGCGGHRPATTATTDTESQGDTDMKSKAERITALIANTKTAFTEDDRKMLETASDERLTALEQHVQTLATAEAAAQAKATDAAAQATAAETKLATAQASITTLEGKVGELETKAAATKSEADWMKDAPARIKTLVASAEAQEQARRDVLVTGLKTAAAAAYTEDELKAMPIDALEKLAKVAKLEEPRAAVNFGLRGVPVQTDDNKIPPPPNINDQIRAAQAAKKAS